MDHLLEAITRIDNQRRGLQAELVAYIADARRQGATWKTIGQALGITPSAARQHYKPLVEGNTR